MLRPKSIFHLHLCHGSGYAVLTLVVGAFGSFGYLMHVRDVCRCKCVWLCACAAGSDVETSVNNVAHALMPVLVVEAVSGGCSGLCQTGMHAMGECQT